MKFTDISLDNPPVFGGNIYDSPTPYRVLDFSSNNNILKTPACIARKIKKCNTAVNPDITSKKAIANLAKKHSIGTQSILTGNSNWDLLNLVVKSLRLRSATVVMPCEAEYKHICRINNCDIIPYILQSSKDFVLDCDDFIEKITSKSDGIIISNPCSVTGRMISRGDINSIIDYCQSKGIYVIIDETYMNFTLNGFTAIDMIKDYNNLVVIKSVSEYYNLQGINCAYLASNSEINEIIDQNRIHRSIDVYGNCLLENAYKDEKFELKTKKWIFENKKYLLKKLRQIDSLKVTESDCHFVLVSLGEASATTLYNRLLKSNILIRDASSFTGLDGSYIRIAVKDKKATDRLTEEIVRCLL